MFCCPYCCAVFIRVLMQCPITTGKFKFKPWTLSTLCFMRPDLQAFACLRSTQYQIMSKHVFRLFEWIKPSDQCSFRNTSTKGFIHLKPNKRRIYHAYKNNNQMRGGLERVRATGMYRSIGHVGFSKFQTGNFVECRKAPQLSEKWKLDDGATSFKNRSKSALERFTRCGKEGWHF